MSARAVSRLLVAVGLASLLGATAAVADSKAFRFTYPEAGVLGNVVLGPGAARGVKIRPNPIIDESPGMRDAKPEGEVFEVTSITFLAQNAPDCKEPKVEAKGNEAFVTWESDCALPSYWVEVCIRANLPIITVEADFVDQYGEFLAAADVTELTGVGCDLDCSGAFAVESELWPPNHRMIPVTISGIVGGVPPVTIEATGITHDEALNDRGDGNTCPDGTIEDGVASVRRERSGRGNGRVYVVSFTATDASGASCDGQVAVCVPHDQEHPCVDDGQSADALGPCPVDTYAQPLEDKIASSVHVEAAGGRARLAFALPSAAKVDVGLFDVAGRRVADVESGMRSAGAHELSWDVSGLAHGVYFVRMRAGEVSVSKTLLVTE